MNGDILQVKGLKKYFPVTAGIFRHVVAHVKAVNGVDFSLPEGSVLGLVGESGSGKSTIGRTILRLIDPTEGVIEFFNKDITAFTKSEEKNFRKQAQIVFQNPYVSLNPRKTIGDSIGEVFRFHGLCSSPSEEQEKVAETLSLVGISPDTMHNYPHQFSGGQQQRICIGRAIASHPKLLVCDEALSALDVSVQAQILNLLQALKVKQQLSYLFISHDLSVVRYLCDRVVVLYLGKVMESATTHELFSNPKHPYTQALLSATPRRHPSHISQRMILKGEIPSPLDPPSGCPFRTRCPFAQPICAETPPHQIIKDSQTGKDDHHYHCILD